MCEGINLRLSPSVVGKTERILLHSILVCTRHSIMFSVIINIYTYNKKTKGPTLMELFTATGKLKKFFLDN